MCAYIKYTRKQFYTRVGTFAPGTSILALYVSDTGLMYIRAWTWVRGLGDPQLYLFK